MAKAYGHEHDDALADKDLFGKMMKKAVKKTKTTVAPMKKVKAHLKEDIKEQTSGIKKDVKLAKSLKKKAR